MSPLDFSEDDLIDAMSAISPTGSEVDPIDQSLVTKSPTCPPTPKLRIESTSPVTEATGELRHPKFPSSRFVVVQVEHTLYHVPRTLIQQSETNKDQILQDDAGDALHVDGISTVEMEAFLDVSDARLITGDDHFSFEQWAGALAVANRLLVPQIRNYAIRRLRNALGRLNPFDCIDVALKYRVQEWLFRPFLRICERQEPLSSAEIVRLGSERSTAVVRVREKLLVHKNELETTWIRDRWPKKRPGRVLSIADIAEPRWTEMSETVAAALATEAKRLIELETVLTKPDFEPVSPSAQSSFDPIPDALPHPKYWQRSSLAIKVDNCLYELPIRYFDSSSLLGDNRDGLSADSCDPITLPQDIKAFDWDVFLEIATARPFDEPPLSLPFTSWVTGLRVAKRLEVDSTRRYILQRIQSDFPTEDPIDLLEAVRIGGAAHSGWVQDLYAKLSQRESSITSQEIRRIGVDATAEVWKLRDTYLLTKGR